MADRSPASAALPTSAGLAGQAIIITGGSKGIGLGIARHLGSLGAKVAITGRNQERLDTASAELTELGIEHLTSAGNVADREANTDLVAATIDRFGRLDGVVANAQSFRPVTPLAEVSEDDLNLLLGTGPKGTLWLMQAALPHFVAQNRGRVVTMGSIMARTGAPGYGPYSAANAAIESLTRTAAREWGRYGVTVNCVCPASAAHRLDPNASPERKSAFEAMYANHPLGRDGDPDTDIAPIVAFLLSDASQYLTGETLMADGGGSL